MIRKTLDIAKKV